MAAISVTQIGLGSDAETAFVQFGVAVSVGNSVYMDTSDSNKWKLADADSTEATAGRDRVGIALHNCPADAYGIVVLSGTMYIDTLGASAKGTTFVVGSTAGAINPDSDSASTWYKTVLGVGGTESVTGTYDTFTLTPIVSGAVIA